MQALIVLFLLALSCSTTWAQGKVTPKWESGKTANGEAVRQILATDPIHQNLPQYINSTFRLPRDLPVEYLEDGKLNASYSPSEHKIVMSYDLGAFLYGIFEKNGSLNPAEDMKATMGFVLLHEMGHAMIYELGLPQVGRGEDAADEFAAIVGIQAVGDRGTSLALVAANWFYMMDKSAVDIKKLPFWDEHSLNSQRFYRILCNVYGSDPARFQTQVSPIVPYTRLRLAQERYPKKVERWNRLLAAHRLVSDQNRLHKPFPLRTSPAKVSLAPTSGGLLPFEEVARIGVFQGLVDRLNASFRLPKNLTVVSRSTDFNRNFFLPITGQIIMSQEFFSDAKARLFKRLSAPEAQETLSALEQFSLLQEFCLALVNDCDLAITGDQEDAAAELTIMMVVSDPGLRRLALPMTRWYATLAQENVNVLSLKYWSESALDQQRFYDLLGYLYSADPQGASFVPQLIEASRLNKMAWEYEQKKQAWGILLKPYGGPF